MGHEAHIAVIEETRAGGIIRETAQGALLSVHVQPKASRTEYVGLHGNRLKFRVAAPPVNGTANEAVCRYLAERFRLSKTHVVVFSGHGARQKHILMRGVSAQRVMKAFFKGA